MACLFCKVFCTVKGKIVLISSYQKSNFDSPFDLPEIVSRHNGKQSGWTRFSDNYFIYKSNRLVKERHICVERRGLRGFKLGD